MQIVLVDDDPIGVFMTERLLKREGFVDTFTSFQFPVEALGFLRNQILADQLPQVILLDLNMPLIDGWAFLDALKPYEVQLQSQCSIFLLTSSLAPSDIARAEEHPLVAEYIRKPLDSHKIQKIQEYVLSIRQNL